MGKSEKIKRELQKFWLNQLDHCKDKGLHSEKALSSQQRSTLASDVIFQRQLQRLSRRPTTKPAENSSAIESRRINSGEKQVDARPVPTVKFIPATHHASAADKLRHWLSQNVEAGQFDGQFYVKAFDVLSLQQAKQDWNSSAGNGCEPSYSCSDWSAIDDRLMWLSAPSS